MYVPGNHLPSPARSVSPARFTISSVLEIGLTARRYRVRRGLAGEEGRHQSASLLQLLGSQDSARAA
jgi:hypothetical protein